MKLFRKVCFIVPAAIVLLCLISYLSNSQEIDTEGKVCREFSINRRVIQRRYIFIEDDAINAEKDNNPKTESFREVYQHKQGGEVLYFDFYLLNNIVDAQDYYMHVKNNYHSKGIEVDIGDQSSFVQSEIIFVRNNVFVIIKNGEDDDSNLLKIAKDIDKQIIKSLEPE